MILLSYPLDEKTPLYGHHGSVAILPDKCLAGGDSCNTLRLAFSNHAGTHIDCPLHFSPNGKNLSDYDDSFWFVDGVCSIFLPDLPPSGDLIDIKVLAPHLPSSNRHRIRAVLLKTGYCSKRYDEIYWKTPPGIHPETADFLRENFPNLDFFGFDLISLSSFANREIGRQAHRCFLDRPDPILILEDMDLSKLPLDGVSNLLISPLLIKEADGAPCMIWANVNV